MHLFRPYQVMSEIWRCSTATIEQSWHHAPVPPLLGVWWALHLIGSFLSVLGWALQDDYITPVKSATVVGMLSSLLLIFDGVIICYIVNQITSRQEEKTLYISGDN